MDYLFEKFPKLCGNALLNYDLQLMLVEYPKCVISCVLHLQPTTTAALHIAGGRGKPFYVGIICVLNFLTGQVQNLKWVQTPASQSSANTTLSDLNQSLMKRSAIQTIIDSDNPSRYWTNQAYFLDQPLAEIHAEPFIITL